jgi:hypothetical protein
VSDQNRQNFKVIQRYVVFHPSMKVARNSIFANADFDGYFPIGCRANQNIMSRINNGAEGNLTQFWII